MQEWNEIANHLSAETPSRNLPWLVAHGVRFYLLPTMYTLPRGRGRWLVCVLARCVETAHEVLAALPKRELGGAPGDVG